MEATKGARYIRVKNIKEYKDIIGNLHTRGYFRTGKPIVDNNPDGSYIERIEFFNKTKKEYRIYTARFNLEREEKGVRIYTVNRYVLEIR